MKMQNNNFVGRGGGGVRSRGGMGCQNKCKVNDELKLLCKCEKRKKARKQVGNRLVSGLNPN